MGLQGSRPPAEFPEVGALVERLGFDVLTVFGDLLYQPPVLALALAAQATRRIRVGPACLNPYTTHPVEMASQLAMLDHLSAGRAYLGLARGAWLNRLGIPQPRPGAALRDAVEIVGRLLRGDESGYDGQMFRLDPGIRLRQPVQRPAVPMLLGTWSKRLWALAGEVADEVKVGGSAHPEMVAAARAGVRASALGAGRQPDAVGVVMGAVTVVDEDPARARRHARSMVAMYLDVVGGLDPGAQVEPELLGRLHDLVCRGEDEAAGRLIPDRVLDRFAFAGSARQVAAQAAALFEAGAHRVEFGPPHSIQGTRQGLELLAARVLPELRQL